MNDLWPWIVLGAMVAGGVLAALFQSLRDLPRTTLEELITTRDNERRNARARAILNDIEGHATAVALPRIVCNLTLAVGIVMWLQDAIGGAAPEWVAIVGGVTITSLVLWVFGVAIPQGIAKHASARTVYAWSGTLRALYTVMRPFNAVVNFFDEVVRRLSGNSGNQADAREAELLSVVEEARQEGQFDETERDMIAAIVRFRDTTVQQIMTPRTEMHAMELTNNLGEVTGNIRRIGHSRIPVYEETLDRIAGIFYVKDLMRWLAGENRSGKSFDLKHILRPAIFVPETKTIRELLAELIEKKVHMAIVADEYGGTAGLVTFEDIVEEILGDIQDEYEVAEEEAPEVKLDQKRGFAEIDARSYIEDANNEVRPLGVEFPESEEYDTVGGFVTVTLGRIPSPGESLSLDGMKVTVLEAEPTRVTRVRIEPAPEAPAPGAGAESAEAAAG